MEDLVAYLLQQVLGPHHLLFEGVTEGGHQQWLMTFQVPLEHY